MMDSLLISTGRLCDKEQVNGPVWRKSFFFFSQLTEVAVKTGFLFVYAHLHKKLKTAAE